MLDLACIDTLERIVVLCICLSAYCIDYDIDKHK